MPRTNKDERKIEEIAAGVTYEISPVDGWCDAYMTTKDGRKFEAHTVSKREAQKSLVYFWQWDNRKRSLEWLSSDEGRAFFERMKK